MTDDTNGAREVEAFVARAAAALDDYANAARAARMSDLALVSQDAADALFNLLDVLVARSRGVVPVPTMKV